MTNLRPTSRLFTVGGTLPLDAAYVVRPADEQSLRATLSGECCNARNPAPRLDRALAYARLDQYDDVLADSSLVIELDPDRQEEAPHVFPQSWENHITCKWDTLGRGLPCRGHTEPTCWSPRRAPAIRWWAAWGSSRWCALGDLDMVREIGRKVE